MLSRDAEIKYGFKGNPYRQRRIAGRMYDSWNSMPDLRCNTERPVTLIEYGGASVLVGNNIELIRKEFHSALNKQRTPARPELWDGHTAERCLKAIIEYK
jgi:hypothetical protein